MGNMDVDTGAPVSAAMMDCEWLDGGGGRLCRSIGVPLDEKRTKICCSDSGSGSDNE